MYGQVDWVGVCLGHPCYQWWVVYDKWIVWGFLTPFFSLGLVALIKLGFPTWLGGLVLSMILGTARRQCPTASGVGGLTSDFEFVTDLFSVFVQQLGG